MIICTKACRIMRCALHKLSILLCVVAFVSCEWVNDDYSDCPIGTWLHFSYTYNILDVDAAYNQVDDLCILIFDNDGKYLGAQKFDYVQFQQNGAMVELELPQGEYKVLVWGGLSDSNYEISELKIGETLCDDVMLALSKNDAAAENSNMLNSLFHTYLDSVTVADYYNVIEAPLVKNTNHFSILIQCDSYDDSLGDEFGVVIRSDNAVMDYLNNIVKDNYVNYTPYKQFTTDVTNTSIDGATEVSSMLVSYLNTLRLMVGDDLSLTIIHKATDDRLLDISLIQYLLLTRGYYDPMESQEYLDRQDSYSLIFYLEKCDDSLSGYMCTKVSVNGWIIRFSEAELKK